MARYLIHFLMIRECIFSTHLYSIDFMFHVVKQETVSLYVFSKLMLVKCRIEANEM